MLTKRILPRAKGSTAFLGVAMLQRLRNAAPVNARSLHTALTQGSANGKSRTSPLDIRRHSSVRWKSTDETSKQPQTLGKIDKEESRMLIGFTCKVCQHRQYKTMSKHAYQHGVVLIQCDECKNRHLIADHLGWFQDKSISVENLMREKGEEVRQLKDMDLLDDIEAGKVKSALSDYDKVLEERNKSK